MTKINDAAKVALAAYLEQEAMYEAFKAIMNEIYRLDNYSKNDSLHNANEIITNKLLANISDALRTLLMWAHLDADCISKELKTAIINKYIGQGKMIMQYLERGLHMPKSYSTSEEEAFRAEIDEWIAANLPKIEKE
jgi:hypothetical protein